MDIRLLPDLAFEADQRALQEDLVHALDLLNNKEGAQPGYLCGLYRWRGPHRLRSNARTGRRTVFNH